MGASNEDTVKRAPLTARWLQRAQRVGSEISARTRGIRRSVPRFRRWDRWKQRLRIAGFALGGAVLAVLVAGRVPADIGPFDATVAVGPSRSGQTTVHLAPLGTIVLDTHDWPLALHLTADQIGLQEAERIAANPEVIDEGLGDDVAEDVRRALERLAMRCALAAVVGGIVGALLARVHWRSAMAGLGASAVLVVGVGVGTAVSFDANAVSEPRYTGLLTTAPAAVGDIETIIDRYGEYRAQLSELVANVVTLYLTAEDLPTFQPDDDTISVLHVSDVHLNIQAFDLMQQVTEQFAIDAIVDTGDLTDWGTGPETRLVSEVGRLDVPYVFVRGNHDSQRIQDAVAEQPNAVVLDGEAASVAGLRFWGIGDPRYTPNKDREVSQDGTEQEQAEAFAPEVADQVADAEDSDDVDVVMIHDERAAADLGGVVPLVLAGHTHEARQDRIDPVEDEDEDAEDGSADGSDGDEDGAEGDSADGDDSSDDDANSADGDGADGEEAGAAEPEETLLMVEGSTGGAGLRGLQGEEPEPLAATILYFDADTKRLVAYDRITLQGFGETGATIGRHVLAPPNPEN